MASKLPPNILFVSEPCAGHVVWRRTTSFVVDSKAFVGYVHAIQQTGAAVGHSRTLHEQLWKLVDQLDVRYDWPEAACAGDNAAVVSHTFLRVIEHTRGILYNNGHSAHTASGEDQHSGNARRLLALLNGKWKGPRMVHYCVNCNLCLGGPEDCKKNVCAAPLDVNILLNSGGKAPTSTDWGTISQHCSHHSLDIWCHKILPHAYSWLSSAWMGHYQILRMGLAQMPHQSGRTQRNTGST